MRGWPFGRAVLYTWSARAILYAPWSGTQPNRKKIERSLTALGMWAERTRIVMNAIYTRRQRAIPAIPFSPRWRRLGHHWALLGLIGAFGVLAFIFSAVSPDDDDIQPDLVQSNKSKKFIFATYKAPSYARGLRTSPVCSASLYQRPQRFVTCHAIALIVTPHEEIEATIL